MRNMFNRKDRQIANLSQMIINRDKLIDTLQERKEYYKSMSESQREDIKEYEETLKAIEDLAKSNNYNNAETVLGKIKELVTTANHN